MNASQDQKSYLVSANVVPDFTHILIHPISSNVCRIGYFYNFLFVHFVQTHDSEL